MARAGLLSNIIYILFIGTALVGVIGILIGQLGDTDTFDLISLSSLDDIGGFMVILISWLIAAAVVGIRSKNAFNGALAAFLGTSLGAIIIGFFFSGIITVDLIAAMSSPDFITIDETKMDNIIPFMVGIVVILFSSVIAAAVTGSLVKEEPKARATGRSRKTWEAGKHKDKWICHKCKANIPAGAMTCPKCGTPVIE
ncbi:MAG: zinc-ribbon domain-containing protein [Candidatus Hodarchaeales archaeon]